MVTLTFGDFTILFLMNLALAVLVAYAVNYAKRKAELSAEEGSNDKEYLKKTIRDAVTEARNVLTELRVHEFGISTGRRRLARMNLLVEKISLADTKLGTVIWQLVNVPVLIDVYSRLNTPESEKEILELKNKSFNDLEKALQRCAELEKNPIVKK